MAGVVVLGAGPGIGCSVARRFVRGGRLHHQARPEWTSEVVH